MKRSKLNLAWMLLLAVFAFAACEKEDDSPNPNLTEDGMYVVGEATPWTELTSKALLAGGINENGGVKRASLYEKYVALEAGKEFQIIEVAGKTKTKYGADELVNHNTYGNYEQPNVIAQYGTFKEDASFTVPASGLYQIAIDKELGRIAIIPVNYWGILGGATEAGWSDTKMELDGAFSKTSMKFKVTGLVLRKGDYKLRHGSGWKFGLDDSLATAAVRVNTNFGGAIDALVRGGGNIDFPKEKEGEYTVEIVWAAQTSGMGITASLTKTGTVDPIDFPEAMYISGGATAYGWAEPGTDEQAIMHKVAGGAGNAGLFWKICHFTGGEGFKLAAAKEGGGWGTPNLGHGGVDEFDADGIAVTDVDGNMVIAESGMYIIVLDLRNDLTKISVKAAKVYGMGDAFGGWDEDVAANLFTIDITEKTITSPALTAAGTIRMYTSHSWIKDWWQAEFVVNGTDIEYRNDGNNDPTIVGGTAGQVITLHFDDNTGSII